MASESEKKGQCLCGAVRLTVKPASHSIGACHCNMCQKWTGGPLLAVECGGDVRIEGSDYVQVYDSSEWAERGFCRKCGSHLFFRLKQGEHYALPVGIFEDPDDWVFEQQIFIDEKPSFYSFANDTENLTGAQVFAQFGASPE